MNHPDIDPAHALADGFGRQVQAWSLGRGAPAAAAQAAGWAAQALSLASSQGHVCWPLSELQAQPGSPIGAQAWASALRASGVVGPVTQPGNHPLVLDDALRLYLHRDFDHERALACRLLRAAAAPAAVWPASASVSASDLLAELFGPPTPGRLNWQQIAAALALRQRLVVISGGPGTGKTTTVVQLLAALISLQPGCRIALAAPTGKAAARMAQALQARAASLPTALRLALPQQASTVHRLLGATAVPGVFLHDAAHPLAIDALVVDEASMLDLALARRLLDAVPSSARIVLLGDKDQLAAVESGAVFAELCACPALSLPARQDLAQMCRMPAEDIVPPAADITHTADAPAVLHDSVVWLQHNHRFATDSAIGRLAAAVQAGDASTCLGLLQSAGPDAGPDANSPLRWLEAAAPTTQQMGEQGYEPFLQALLQHPHDPARAHAAFAAFRVLCALRQGPQGMLQVGEKLSQHARSRLAALQPPDASPMSNWYAGRPVMVLRNDAALGLFNGDIGIALAAHEPADGEPALRVWFATAAEAGVDAEAKAEQGFRAFAPARLPIVETAFAMTVHKAQGSEFDAVLLRLPAQGSRVLTRELLYTAVTRARQQVLLAGSAAVVAQAVATPTRRYSGLQARLQEQVQQASAAPG